MSWAPDYLTTSQLKGWLRIADTVDDAELAVAITAASRAVDRCCGRQFGQVAAPEARTFVARYDRHLAAWVADIDDVQTVTGLVVPTTDYDLGPVNALLKGSVYTRLVLGSLSTAVSRGCESAVAVTARWGWSAVPETVALATRLQASRFMARRDSPFGVAGSPDQGTELRLLAKVDPDVELMLASYRRRWYAA